MRAPVRALARRTKSDRPSRPKSPTDGPPESTSPDGSLLATDNSTIATDAQAASLAAALGIGGAVSISVSLSENTITNRTAAFVDNAKIRNSANYTTASGVNAVGLGNRVRVASGYDGSRGRIGGVYEFLGQATDYTSTDSSQFVNVNQLVSVDATHTAGGSTGQVYKYLGPTVDLLSQYGTQAVETGDHVRVAITHNANLGRLAGLYEYIGASPASLDLSVENFKNTTLWKDISQVDLSAQDYLNTTYWENVSTINLSQQNYLDTTVWREVLDDFSVEAVQSATITAASSAASLSAGVGAASGGGANSMNTIATTTLAYLRGADVIVSGDLSVHALETTTATADVGTANVAIGVGFSIAAGGSVANVNFNGAVSSYIDDSTVVARDIDLLARSVPQGTATGLGVNAGALAVGASIATINLATNVSTTVDGNITARSLSAKALLDDPASGKTSNAITTGATGGLIGIDSTNSRVNNNATISATLGNDSTFQISGATRLSAVGQGEHYAKADSYAGGVLAAGVSSARIVNNSTVTTGLGSGIVFAGGSLAISADSNQRQFSDTFAGSGGVAAGASASAKTVNQATTLVNIGNNTAVNLTGAFEINALGSGEVNGKVKTFAGGLLAGAGARVNNDVNHTTKATIGTGAIINAHDIRIDASSAARKPDIGEENIRGTTGGLIAGASAKSITEVDFDTAIVVGNNAQLNVVGSESNPGSMSLTTLNKIYARDKVNFTTGGALLGCVGGKHDPNDGQ